jgi:SAM-dependent methyltransferase
MQFLDILKALPGDWKLVFILVIFFISILVYRDSSMRGLSGPLWSAIFFFFPLMLPVYIIVRPKHTIAFCEKCFRILPRDSDDCYFCEKGIPVEEEPDDYSVRGFVLRSMWQFFLDICRTYNQFLGFIIFFFRRKFLLLNLKLLFFYSWGMCHQTVATEGRNMDIPINTLTYGETPFLSAWRLFRLAGLNKRDVFYDLGSGTGNVVFFCNILYGIESVGIDAIPTFIDYSNKIKESLKFEQVNFIKGNFLLEDFSKGTVFFIVSTVFDPDTREKLAEKFKEVSPGTRVITVSHVFDVPHLKVKTEEKMFFSWGYENIYLHERI